MIVRCGVIAVALCGALVSACTSSPPPPSTPSPTQAVASTTTTATTPPTPAAPSPTQTLPPGTFENALLGYRITLPERYRRIGRIFTGQPEPLGDDIYTRTTEAEAREACSRDTGDVPTVPAEPELLVRVSRNVRGVTAAEWIRPGHERQEATSINGLDAVRLFEDNARASTTRFVIRANDRIFEISTVIGPGGLFLEGVAKTFLAVAPGPFPSPTPTIEPRLAATALVGALASAFASRDADAVVRLMRDCRIGVGAVVGGLNTGGVLNRSVERFARGLRDRFSAGDLTVTIDPTLIEEPLRYGTPFFVRSEWREPDRTTSVDLLLTKIEGRWVWLGANHYYPRFNGPGCIPYRSPWVDTPC